MELRVAAVGREGLFHFFFLSLYYVTQLDLWVLGVPQLRFLPTCFPSFFAQWNYLGF